MTAGTVTATLRLGTRGSALARTQSQAVADAITAATGRAGRAGAHRDRGRPLVGGDRAARRHRGLRRRDPPRAHSRAASTSRSTATRTCPTAPEPGLIIAAVPAREDPRDALVARDGLTLGELPPGSTVGTGAPRRVAQLRALGLGLDIVPIRGNVDTRLGRVGRPGTGRRPRRRRPRPRRAGPAGPARRDHRDPRPPAGAAGAGAGRPGRRVPRPATPAPASCSAGSRTPSVRACVVAERSTLAALEAGCSAPVAAYAEVAEGEAGPELFLRASVTAIDGSDAVRGSVSRPTAGGRRPRAGPGHGTPRPRRGRAHGGHRTDDPPACRTQTPATTALRARIRSTR